MDSICSNCIFLSKHGRTVKGITEPDYKLYSWICDKNLFVKITSSTKGPDIEVCNRFEGIVNNDNTTDIITG